MSVDQAATPPPPAPGSRRVFASWGAAARWPAVWFFVALTIAGIVILGIAFGPAIAESPGAFVLAAVLFAIHGAVFVTIIRAVDWLEPEPRWLFAAALIWGGFVASANALRANTALESILVKITSLGFVRDWAAAIEGPTDEEILKTLGIVMIVLLARRQINSVLDGVVYGAFVGLGFQEIENITYSLNAVAAAGDDSVAAVLQVFLVRGLLAGLWSHTVYSAIAGAGVAYAVLHRERSWFNRIGVALGALALAWLMHFLWNSPAAASLTDYAGSYGTLLVLLIKGLLILGTFLVLLHFFRKDEYEGVAGPLESLHNPWIATHNEIVALRGWRSRGRARWNAYVYGGLRAYGRVRQLQRAQADLAVEMRDNGPAGFNTRLPELQRARYGVYELGITDADALHPTTTAGLISFILAFAVLINPIFLILPLGFLVFGVARARSRHQRADPRLRTAAILALVFALAYLVSVIARAAALV
ncbi:Membrane proteinase PrsW, cleaves anti-sigma factor RsiW, M82 family [Asanoa hainanensis]|uniref:Membrane proteinase PrsW, cleaves anti-sigma factor RsiW, M82 family n=1 Tax=Asanoa hainanensis TaxID=560556 RepID=A0A239NTZ2_9ACTN|nr:PrsW family intramembrane metalloprotease [Asanoa hainanensis]SNT57913.1 Membrane proteinase PrsW, cleaves anti-sigma factor RsiW, M82 family [Asanoa hainanensis]